MRSSIWISFFVLSASATPLPVENKIPIPHQRRASGSYFDVETSTRILGESPASSRPASNWDGLAAPLLSGSRGTLSEELSGPSAGSRLSFAQKLQRNWQINSIYNRIFQLEDKERIDAGRNALPVRNQEISWGEFLNKMSTESQKYADEKNAKLETKAAESEEKAQKAQGDYTFKTPKFQAARAKKLSNFKAEQERQRQDNDYKNRVVQEWVEQQRGQSPVPTPKSGVGSQAWRHTIPGSNLLGA